MTNEDFLLLADHVVRGPLSEVALSYEGKLPRGVGSKIESAIRNAGISALGFQMPAVTDTKEETEAKNEANAQIVQKLLSA